MGTGIELISSIVPKNDGDFATHDSKYGKGGWHSVGTIPDRDAIPSGRRRAGMAVNVLDVNKIYQLAGDLVTWVEIPLGSGGAGIGEAPIDGSAYVRKLASWDPIDNYLDGGIIV